MSTTSLFTSESVSEGHPDKVSDQISDAILDALLEQDPHSRVAVETLVTTGLAVVSGEVTTNGYVDVQGVTRDVIKEIGDLSWTRRPQRTLQSYLRGNYVWKRGISTVWKGPLGWLTSCPLPP